MALTNVASADGKAIEPETIHQGYIIHATGLELGLTEENTRNFTKTQLKASTVSPAENDWDMVDVAISVNGSAWNSGNALFDTGIEYSFIRLDEQTARTMNTQAAKDPVGHVRKVLTDNSVVEVRIADDIATYRVNNADTKNPMLPYKGEYVLEDSTRPPAYINTGRRFYLGFSAMLDVECGLFGLRESDIGGEGKQVEGPGVKLLSQELRA